MFPFIFDRLRRLIERILALFRRRAVGFKLAGMATPKGTVNTDLVIWYAWSERGGWLLRKLIPVAGEGDSMADTVELKVGVEDGLLTALTIDKDGGPAPVQPGTIMATSGDNSIIGDGVLAAPEAPGQTAFAFRCESKGTAGQQATLRVTAKSLSGADLAPGELVFKIVEVPAPPPEAVGFTVSGQAVPKP